MGNNLNTKLDANQVLRQAYDEPNQRLRVDAEVSATIGQVEVAIDAAGGDNIAIADPTGTNYLQPNPDGSINVVVDSISLDQATDSIAIGDGTNLIDINPDGSINVVLTSSGYTTKNIYNEITSVASGVTSTVGSYVAIANTKLFQVDVSGTNIAKYEVWINGVLVSKRYTYYSNLNETFNFSNGLPVTTGHVIEIKVKHDRPDLGDFNVNIIVEN